VNVKAAFLFLALLALLAFDVYFWAFHWTPTRRALRDLMEENARLVGAIEPGATESSESSGKPENTFDTAEGPSLPEEVENLLKEGESQPSDKNQYTYKATELFSGKETHLTTAGKTLLSNIAIDLKSRSYSRVIARVYPDSDYSRSKPFGAAQKRSMAIIQYLSQRGISGKKLLAVPINTRYRGGKVVILIEK
jgi:outer membrane protein OmpA-like peptidoglycan-associated protein